MGSRERLWSIYGEAWGWPPASMTAEQDREDLQHHWDEVQAHESFNYALFDAGETELVGCVYIDPTDKAGADADISWWVRDEHVGSPVEAALDELVPAWIAADWPLTPAVRRPRPDLGRVAGHPARPLTGVRPASPSPGRPRRASGW